MRDHGMRWVIYFIYLFLVVLSNATTAFFAACVSGSLYICRKKKLMLFGIFSEEALFPAFRHGFFL